MNVTEFGNYPNRSARGTHPRRAESYTDTITQMLARRQVSQHVSRSGEWALLFRDRQKSRARFFRRCRSGCRLFRLTASGGKTSDQSRFDHATVTKRITGLLETSGRGRSEAEAYPRGPWMVGVAKGHHWHGQTRDFATWPRPRAWRR